MIFLYILLGICGLLILGLGVFTVTPLVIALYKRKHFCKRENVVCAYAPHSDGCERCQSCPHSCIIN